MGLMIVLALVGVAAGGSIAWLYCKTVFTRSSVPLSQHETLQERYNAAATEAAVAINTAQQLKAAVDKAEAMALHCQAEATEAAVKAGTAVTELANLRTAHTRLQQERTEWAEQLKAQFTLLAGQVLDSKTQTFNQQQETKLTDLLNPFKKQIEDFQKQVDEKFIAEGKEKSALQREIELLHKASTTLGKQATDLTEALRGSTKQQGDWGEGILEGILEHCGLTSGIHYTTQAASRTEDGTSIRPDVLVHLPGNRNLVIDSKVSLVHYWDYCAADADAKTACLPLMAHSLRQHIDGLYKKPYHEVAGTPDYIIMFVPVEAAYITVLQHDATLWQYAYGKGIVLISPTNLIPFLRIVQTLWDRDDKYRNSQAIAEKAGRLYDKLATFVNSYAKVGAALEGAQKSFAEGMGQLTTGRDNLIIQAEKMKALNITNKKDLPLALTETALLQETVAVQTVD